MKTNHDPKLYSYEHFKTYSKILSNVIRTAKNVHENGLILNSNNKIKTTWNIIKMITGKRTNNTKVQFLNIGKKLTDNPQQIADSFNDYFLIIVGKINSNNVRCHHPREFNFDKHKSYLSQAFPTLFPEIKLETYLLTYRAEPFLRSHRL
jgi:hypothetical protein